jgi:hypothetical protein
MHPFLSGRREECEMSIQGQLLPISKKSSIKEAQSVLKTTIRVRHQDPTSHEHEAAESLRARILLIDNRVCPVTG